MSGLLGVEGLNDARILAEDDPGVSITNLPQYEALKPKLIVPKGQEPAMLLPSLAIPSPVLPINWRREYRPRACTGFTQAGLHPLDLSAETILGRLETIGCDPSNAEVCELATCLRRSHGIVANGVDLGA